jgi:hypothetical protein
MFGCPEERGERRLRGKVFGRGTACVRSNSPHLLQTCDHFQTKLFCRLSKNRTNFPGWSIERRHVVVAVALQLKH